MYSILVYRNNVSIYLGASLAKIDNENIIDRKYINVNRSHAYIVYLCHFQLSVQVARDRNNILLSFLETTNLFVGKLFLLVKLTELSDT